LKHLSLHLVTQIVDVAPHAGAWIETSSASVINLPGIVAPHAGAWIETPHATPLPPRCRSLPTRERGLKRIVCRDVGSGKRSLPTRERGLKHRVAAAEPRSVGSLPTRERGLKREMSKFRK
jgi:hypothetical protein